MGPQSPRTGPGAAVTPVAEQLATQRQKRQRQCAPTGPQRPSNQQAWMETAKGKAAASSCDQQKGSATKTSQRFKRRPKPHSTSVL